MSGGGTNYRKKASRKVCPRKIGLFFNKLGKSALKSCTFFNRLAESPHKIRNSVFRARNFGGILIEFAFSIPVLIILMFFVIDHYRIYELKNKVRSSAYLIASMIQQIGNIKTNKKLTEQDLQRITFASCLNFFHTKTMFSPYPFGITLRAGIIWVKRISANNYTYVAVGTDLMMMSNGQELAPTQYYYNKTEADIKSVHPDLVCSADNDERVMVVPFYCGVTASSADFDKAKLGFFVTPIKLNSSTSSRNFPPNIPEIFAYKLVFTPKPGLFPVQ